MLPPAQRDWLQMMKAMEECVIEAAIFRGSNGASGESGHMLAAVSGEERISCMCENSGCFKGI